MEHIANYLKKDPLSVREVNFLANGDPLLFGAPIYERENMIPLMIEHMKKASEYEARKSAIENFNKVLGCLLNSRNLYGNKYLYTDFL